MATCSNCGQDMLTADGCVLVEVRYPDGLVLDPKPYGFKHSPEHMELMKEKSSAAYYSDYHEQTWWKPVNPESRCHDCGVKFGHYHHPGCDDDICPRCGWQLIGCDCFSVLDSDSDDDEGF